MSNLRPRASSPSRQYDKPRASTGSVYAYDTVSTNQSARSGAGTVSSHPSSVSYDVRPVRQTTYQDGKRTEYLVKPRRNSVTGQEGRHALTLATRDTSPPRRENFVTSPREMTPSSALRDDSARLLHPSSSHRSGPSHHARHNSTGRTEMDRYDPGRDGRDRVYHLRGSQGPPTPRQYYSSRPQLPRQPDDEEWSYTGPREQFDRDYPIRSRRDSSNRRERPTSIYEVDRPSGLRREYGPPRSANRKFESSGRENNPRYSQDSGFDSDPDRPNEHARRRQNDKAPVLHQHPQHEDGYSSAREDHGFRSSPRARDGRRDDEHRRKERPRDSYREPDRDRRRERDYDSGRDRPREYDRSDRTEPRRKPRSRDPSPERSRFKDLAVGALGSLATAGTLTLFGLDNKDKDREKDMDVDADRNDGKDQRRRRRKQRKDGEVTDDSDGHSPRENIESRRHRRHNESEDDSYEDRGERTRPPRQERKEAPAEDDSYEDRGERTRPSRRGEKKEEAAEDDSYEDRGDRRRPARQERKEEAAAVETNVEKEVDAVRPPRDRSSSRTRSNDESPPASGSERQVREPAPPQNRAEEPRSQEGRTMSPGENEDSRPRRVQLVEPERKQDIKPRGILKPTRMVPFPEDPNPIREGVAPLKDATKGGIPANSRWTKINRVLVNPEALEKAQERFEEREDYVIVLRVLTREEIQKLAAKTKEIRESRERDWQRKLDERRHQGDTSDDQDDDDRDGKPQLMLEQAPSAPPVDLRTLANFQSGNAPQQPAMVNRSAPGSYTGSNVNVSESYSQNV